MLAVDYQPLHLEATSFTCAREILLEGLIQKDVPDESSLLIRSCL